MPTRDFDAEWGRSVINGKLFTALVYRGLKLSKSSYLHQPIRKTSQ
jgi:hypothetical protein